jgi:hypothetical protein
MRRNRHFKEALTGDKVCMIGALRIAHLGNDSLHVDRNHLLQGDYGTLGERYRLTQCPMTMRTFPLC